MEVNRELWDFFQNQDDPDFEKKFEALIKTYLNNAINNGDRFSSKKDVYFFKSIVQQDNWLAKWPLNTASYSKGKKEQELDRLSSFMYYAEYLKILDDYYSIYGSDKEAYLFFIKGYLKLSKAHQKGYEEEKTQKKEKSKMDTILSSLTGAVTGKMISSGLQKDKKEKEDINNGDGKENR